MSNIFGSIFTNSLTLGTCLISIIASLVLGLILTLGFMYRNTYTKSFITALVLIPAIEAVVIMMVNDNLGVGLSVAGSFALIRFRSVKGSAKELATVFMAMTIGIMCGSGFIALAAVFTLVITLAMFILTLLNYGGQSINERYLKVTIPESLDYEDILDEVLDKYTTRYELESVKTLSLGSLFRVDYSISMKNKNDIKKMIDELRVKNGNLEITCSKQVIDREEL